ncbi:hypothetical protein M885DRAFT_46442 [Pelagophyceae sp. CCMP2097]|nr:hypothetical protein M885DRAFT_46442 [Pelagophyceae sp. CCMP2097]
MRAVRASHAAALGLPGDASAEELRRAFRRLAMECHPDKNHAAEATARFQEVNAAYAWLTQHQPAPLTQHQPAPETHSEKDLRHPAKQSARQADDRGDAPRAAKTEQQRDRDRLSRMAQDATSRASASAKKTLEARERERERLRRTTAEWQQMAAEQAAEQAEARRGAQEKRRRSSAAAAKRAEAPPLSAADAAAAAADVLAKAALQARAAADRAAGEKARDVAAEKRRRRDVIARNVAASAAQREAALRRAAADAREAQRVADIHGDAAAKRAVLDDAALKSYEKQLFTSADVERGKTSADLAALMDRKAANKLFIEQARAKLAGERAAGAAAARDEIAASVAALRKRDDEVRLKHAAAAEADRKLREAFVQEARTKERDRKTENLAHRRHEAADAKDAMARRVAALDLRAVERGAMACEDESGRAARKRNRKAVAAAEESRRETRAMAADDAAASSLRPAWAREAHECVAMARSDVASRPVAAAEESRRETRAMAADDAAASSLRPAWAREAHECVAMARSDVASRRISAAVACDDGRAEVRSVLDGLVGRIELLCILGGPRPRSSSL